MRKSFGPSPLLLLFALLWKLLVSSMMPQVCPTPRSYVAGVESWRQPPALHEPEAVPSPMSAKGCPSLTWQDILHSHPPPRPHSGTAVFQLQYNRPQCHPSTLQNLLSIEIPAPGRDCNWGWEMKLCPSLKIDQGRMIQISEEAALTPQEWQNLAINSVHHKDTQEKRNKNHLATTATVATAIIPANDNNLCWPHCGLPTPCQLVLAPAINISLFCTQRK